MKNEPFLLETDFTLMFPQNVESDDEVHARVFQNGEAVVEADGTNA